MSGFFLFDFPLIAALLYYLFFIGFFLGAPIVGFVYIRGDADRSGQPGTIWAMSTIFLSWIAVVAYLVVRGLAIQPSRP